MKMILITLLLLLASPASAAEKVKLPSSFLGLWCTYEDPNTLSNDPEDCVGAKRDAYLTVTQDEIRAPTWTCKAVSSKIKIVFPPSSKYYESDEQNFSNQYTIRYRCSGGQGGNGVATWTLQKLRGKLNITKEK
jgi:hypothetical protein